MKTTYDDELREPVLSQLTLDFLLIVVAKTMSETQIATL